MMTTIWRIAVVLALLTTGTTGRTQDYFGGAKWIGAVTTETARQDGTGAGMGRRSIILRSFFKPFKPIVNAELRVCGLGFYELTINGQRVGHSAVAPSWSDYGRTVYFNAYDVTRNLKEGDNEVSVMLGNGYYNQGDARNGGATTGYGAPTLCLLLYVTYDDNTRERLITDERWEWTESPVTFNDVEVGEEYDARREEGRSLKEEGRGKEETGTGTTGDARWKPAVVMAAPAGQLRMQMAHDVRIMERREPKRTTKQDSVLVLDMGERLTGYPEITVQGRRGQRIRITVGNTLRESGRVGQVDGDLSRAYVYIIKGGGTAETWHPRFSWGTFRYVQVEGDVETIQKMECCVLYRSAPRIGSFECSNEVLNTLHRNIDEDIRGDWQATWGDRRRRAEWSWPERWWLHGEALAYNFEARGMMEETMQNVADMAEDDWDGALIALPTLYWLHYGELSLARAYYPTMKRYMERLSERADGHVIKSTDADASLVETGHYYQWSCYFYLLSKHLGHKDEAALWNLRADSIRRAFNAAFYHPAQKTYGGGTIGAMALALYLKLVPEQDQRAVLRRMVADIHARGDRPLSDAVGNRYLFYVLAQHEQHELLYKMVTNSEMPNPKAMTPMENVLIPELLGIQRKGELIEIAPHPAGDLSWCKGFTMSQAGLVRVEWKVKKDMFTMDIDIPQGGFADVYMPYSDRAESVTEGHHTLSERIKKEK